MRPLHERLADNQHIIVAGIGIAIGAVAVTALIAFAVIPAIDLAADATARILRIIRHG